MAKHRRIWNSAVFNKHLREGRGQCVGAYYKPWITIHTVSNLRLTYICGLFSAMHPLPEPSIHKVLTVLEVDTKKYPRKSYVNLKSETVSRFPAKRNGVARIECYNRSYPSIDV